MGSDRRTGNQPKTSISKMTFELHPLSCWTTIAGKILTTSTRCHRDGIRLTGITDQPVKGRRALWSECGGR